MFREKLHWLADVLWNSIRHFGWWALIVFAQHYLRKGLRRGSSQSLQVQETLTKEGSKMEKAYDIKDLEKRLAALGLPMAEKVAKGVLHETVQWFEESAALSTNKMDDIAALAMPQVEAFVAKQADKIDGIEGN